MSKCCVFSKEKLFCFFAIFRRNGVLFSQITTCVCGSVCDCLDDEPGCDHEYPCEGYGVYEYHQNLSFGDSHWVTVYIYEGYWENCLPNGEGSYRQYVLGQEDIGYEIHFGFFVDGYMDGMVTLIWYINNPATGVPGPYTNTYVFSVNMGRAQEMEIPGIMEPLYEGYDGTSSMTLSEFSLFGMPPFILD